MQTEVNQSMILKKLTLDVCLPQEQRAKKRFLKPSSIDARGDRGDIVVPQISTYLPTLSQPGVYIMPTISLPPSALKFSLMTGKTTSIFGTCHVDRASNDEFSVE